VGDTWRAIVLGIIEGLTEFLPISSTGHMVIAIPLMGIRASATPWNVLLWVSQFGAILAVVVYFWRDLWRRTFHPPEGGWGAHVVTKLLAAMVPTVVIGLPLKYVLDPLEESPVATAAALIVGAGAIWYIDRRFRRPVRMTIEDVSLVQAACIGVIQCLSIWPGVSRSGASIMGGMVLGLSPRVATEFSFYLAIPTMLAAAVFRLGAYWSQMTSQHAAVVTLGTATSFVVALLVVAGFMEYVKRYSFMPFVVYRVILGVTVLVAAWTMRGVTG
jgi:undecaprenyl-diphosphatase